MSAALLSSPICQPAHQRPRAASSAHQGSGSRLSRHGLSSGGFLGRTAQRWAPPPTPLLRTQTTAADAAPVQEDAAAAPELVSRVLDAIRDSDGGDKVPPAVRQQVDGWLRQLGDIGEASSTRPLEDANIWGNYEVAYVSMGKSQYGQPAGGRFRGGLGKLLFRTTLLAQSVLQPNLVTNKVAFKLLGLIPGSVGLRGTFVSIPDREGGEDRKDTVKVFFEPPVLSLPGGIHIRTGPSSSVVLKTTYVDERVRLGLGSRGSYFVFTRGGAADAAGMGVVGTEQCSGLGKAILFAMVGGFMLNGAWLVANAGLPPVLRAAGLVQVLLGTALGGICYRGGIVDDNEDRPEVERPGGQPQADGTAAAAAQSPSA